MPWLSIRSAKSRSVSSPPDTNWARISLLSIHELDERIALLEEEIARLKEARSKKETAAPPQAPSSSRLSAGPPDRRLPTPSRNGRPTGRPAGSRPGADRTASGLSRFGADRPPPRGDLNHSLTFPIRLTDSSSFLDVEWLLPTLFDASLLYLSSRREALNFLRGICPPAGRSEAHHRQALVPRAFWRLAASRIRLAPARLTLIKGYRSQSKLSEL